MKQLIFLSALLLIPFLMNAQHGNTTGSNNIQSYGHTAGTNGNYGTFIGKGAGNNNTSTHNTFVGFHAGLRNGSGKGNTYIGVNTGAKTNSGVGNYNSFLGLGAGFSITSGDNNTCLGVNSGNGTTTGSRNVYIGYNAGLYDNAHNKLVIDTWTTSADRNSPLIFGDFAEHYVAIAVNTDPANSDIVLNADGSSPYGLHVGKGILTEKVKVATRGSVDWADYVFESDYDLNSLEEVETFVKENKHLPNVPSAAEVNKNGVDVVEMDATLLRQIEELWLHMIELKKENEALKTHIKELK